GEHSAIAQAHALYFLDLAEAAETGLRGADQPQWLERLDRERENLHTALLWLAEQQEIALGLRLAGALWQFWAARGHLSEGRQWLERLIDLADEHASTDRTTAAHQDGEDWRPLLAKALNGAGVLASRQSDYGRARAFHGRALDIRRTLG